MQWANLWTTATIAISTSSNFKLGTVQSYGRWVGYLYELSCQNGVRSRLQFAIQREQRWGNPHCRFRTNPLKSIPTALIVRFWPKIRLRTLYFNALQLPHTAMPGAANRDLTLSGGGATLGRWWSSSSTLCKTLSGNWWCPILCCLPYIAGYLQLVATTGRYIVCIS